jgi:hypothetical protein
MDPRFLTWVANEPDVRPWIGGEGPIDLAPLISDPRNFALRAETGGWVFVRHEPGTYELHTLFTGRGDAPRRLKAWAEAIRYMFVATDAREIVTRVPRHNKAARYAARLCRFATRFEREGAFRAHTGDVVDVAYMALTIDDWWTTDPEALAAGETFHEAVEAAKREHHSTLQDHPPDETHDRTAGAACLMIAAGNARKGAWFYNRWATLAGYPPVTLLSETPLTFDVGAGVIVEVRDGAMEVIRCP